MKKYGKEILIVVLFVLACVSLALFEYVFRFSSDETLDELLRGTLSRFVGFGFLVAASFLCGLKEFFRIKTSPRILLWCLPCLLVAVCNFPFSALLSGEARITRPELLWLFALDCIAIGLFEETLFRGILLPLLTDLLKKYGAVLPILLNGAIFGLWHLFNLFAGAGIGATLLQVGYSFLIGTMFACVFVRTKSVWWCVLLHAVFDFGGLLTGTVAVGNCHDTVFWILTAAAGVLCFAHLLAYFIRHRKEENAG